MVGIQKSGIKPQSRTKTGARFLVAARAGVKIAEIEMPLGEIRLYPQRLTDRFHRVIVATELRQRDALTIKAVEILGVRF